MMGRCYNPNNCNFKNYGSRGISVGVEWRNNRDDFIEWAINNGYDKSLSLDRINNNGNYEPSNCRWVNQRTQNINKRASIESSTGYVGVGIHSSSYGDNIYYYGRLRDKSGRQVYTGMSKDIIQCVIMRNNYIIENKLGNKLNAIPLDEVTLKK